MKLDVVAYRALHSARLARARAVHLHPTQLSSDVVSKIRMHGIEVHAWDVNEDEALESAFQLEIPKICTDRFQEAFDFRRRR
jgi:glycerophosphoryl diester phosphodiesterase